MSKIIKRIYSTLATNNFILLDYILNIPKCSNCISYKKNFKCEYFSTFYIIARSDNNKCGIEGKKYNKLKK